MNDYLDILAEGLPHVRPDFVDEVRKMEPAELRRRLLIGSDWHGAFSSCLNGIKEIAMIPGGGRDECRMPDDVRRVVETLVKQCPVTWETSFRGKKKDAAPTTP